MTPSDSPCRKIWG